MCPCTLQRFPGVYIAMSGLKQLFFFFHSKQSPDFIYLFLNLTMKNGLKGFIFMNYDTRIYIYFAMRF